MDKYIIELLDTNTRVIVPDFGAFIIKQKEPRLIVFNEFLRYNDGLLIEYVAKSENIDKEAAKKKVIEYVDKAGKDLKDNNEHLISGLGKLVKESTGKITFEEKSDSTKKDSKKEPKKVADTKEEKKVKADEIKKETIKKEDVAKKVSKPEPVKPPEEKEVKKVPPEKPVEKKPDASVAQKEAKKEIVTKKVEKPKEEPKVRPKEEHKLRPTVYQKTEIRKKKKSNSQILVWIILILVINAAIISWFVFNDEIRGLFETQPEDISILEEQPDDQSTDAVDGQEETTVTGDAGIEEKSADVQRPATTEPEAAPEIEEESISLSEKRYYIVAGCFREENNADALVTKLTQKGYDAEKFGKIGNLHAVSYASFIDRAEAQNQLRKIREEEELEAWITYY